MNSTFSTWILLHIPNIAFGAVVALIGYFAPVQGVVYVVLATILIDMIVGLWAAKKQGIGWKSIKLWRTIEKAILACLIIFVMYAIDTEIGIKAIQTHRFVAWLIAGFEVWSILENASKISNHKIFVLLKKFMSDKIKDNTGVDVNK